MQIVSARLRCAGELAQRLRHQARLQADVRVAHLALDLGLRHQGRHRVDRDDVDGAGAHEQLGDLERLLTGVGLGDQQVVESTPSRFAYDGSIACSASMNAQTPPRFWAWRSRGRRACLAGGLRPEDLDDAPARDAADAERDVERRATRWGSTPIERRCRSLSFMTAPLPN